MVVHMLTVLMGIDLKAIIILLKKVADHWLYKLSLSSACEVFTEGVCVCVCARGSSEKAPRRARSRRLKKKKKKTQGKVTNRQMSWFVGWLSTACRLNPFQCLPRRKTRKKEKKNETTSERRKERKWTTHKKKRARKSRPGDRRRPTMRQKLSGTSQRPRC